MNQDRKNRLKRTGLAAVTTAAAVGGLALLRSGSGGGNEDAIPATTTHVIEGRIPAQANLSEVARPVLVDRDRIDTKKHPILRIKIKTGADAPVSQALSDIAQAEGYRADASQIKNGIAADNAIITEALTGSPDDSTAVQATTGKGLEVIAMKPITDPQALHREDPKFVHVSLEK